MKKCYQENVSTHVSNINLKTYQLCKGSTNIKTSWFYSKYPIVHFHNIINAWRQSSSSQIINNPSQEYASITSSQHAFEGISFVCTYKGFPIDNLQHSVHGYYYLVWREKIHQHCCDSTYDQLIWVSCLFFANSPPEQQKQKTEIILQVIMLQWNVKSGART